MTLELHTTGLELAGITLALAYKDRPYSNQNAAASAIRAYLAATDSVIMPMALSPELCAIGDDVLSDIVDEQTNSFGETSAVVKSGYAQRIHAALVTAVERGKR